jgi:hypothetical protein
MVEKPAKGSAGAAEAEARWQGQAMTRGPALKAEEYRELAAQEAELAMLATTNENRTQHDAMAAYYTRLAEAQERLPRMKAALGGKGKRA